LFESAIFKGKNLFVVHSISRRETCIGILLMTVIRLNLKQTGERMMIMKINENVREEK